MPKKSKKKKFTQAEIATRRVDPRYDPRFQRGRFTMRNPSDYTQIGDHGGVHRPTPFRRANFGDRGGWSDSDRAFMKKYWKGDKGGVLVGGDNARRPSGLRHLKCAGQWGCRGNPFKNMQIGDNGGVSQCVFYLHIVARR